MVPQIFCLTSSVRYFVLQTSNKFLRSIKPLHTDPDYQLYGRDGAGVGLHISPLASLALVEMSVAFTEPIFKKKFSWTFLGEIGKLFIVVKLP